jgi:multidrug efflux system membrane fusion protein
MARRRNRKVSTRGAFAAMALIPVLLIGCSRQEQAPFEPWKQPVPVRVATADREDLPIVLNALGTVTPLNSVTVSSRIDGELVSVLFKEGDTVKEGTLLAEIDPRPFEVALAQQHDVELKNAEAELQRFIDLHEKKFIPKQEVTNQEALVMQFRARQKSDQANLDNARLQLSYTRLVAPISGKLGLRRIDKGNLIRSSDTDGLVTITQTQPIAVVFTIPETEVPTMIQALHSKSKPQVQAWDRDQRELLATGTVASADNSIDTSTGTLRLKAVFSNHDGRLFPNQFVNARIHVRDLKDAIVIPDAAVQYGAKGSYVFIVDADSKAQMRPVKLGPSNGQRIAVVEGLAANDRVVLEGLDRLREGGEVIVSNAGEKPQAAATQAGSR